MMKEKKMKKQKERIKNKIKFLVLACVFLMLGLVSAGNNMSVLYGQNSSGEIVPAQIDDDGYLKVDLDLLNVTAGDITASGNLTLGDKITFAFGEVIDNLVDGWIRIVGNLNISTGNISLGGKLLENREGVLYWGGNEFDTNISIMYAENSSGSPATLKLDDNGALKMRVSSVVSNVWQSVGGVAQLVVSSAVNISGDLNVSGNTRVGGSLDVVKNLSVTEDVQIDGDLNVSGNLSVGGTKFANEMIIWRLNTELTGSTSYNPVGSGGSDWEIADDSSSEYPLSPSAITESSGVFSFGSTGYWSVRMYIVIEAGASLPLAPNFGLNAINTTATPEVAWLSLSIDSTGNRQSGSSETLLRITNTTSEKVKINTVGMQANGKVYGNTNTGATQLVFQKIAEL